ncbi:hypothetical protein BDZ97DRAFT_1766046 [Flammula alnicola]|nr:hypothetical protein BDZ97DRAFT_1766046 [Flammula alnicola]
MSLLFLQRLFPPTNAGTWPRNATREYTLFNRTLVLDDRKRGRKVTANDREEEARAWLPGWAQRQRLVNLTTDGERTPTRSKDVGLTVNAPTDGKDAGLGHGKLMLAIAEGPG